MSLTATPNGDRVQIAIFGRRNAGKSSVINAVTGQQLAIVSDVKGTTTDPVYKAMEILPIGPCMFIDTPGLDDEGELGRLRVQKAMQVLSSTDIAVLVVDAAIGLRELDRSLVACFRERKIPYITVYNKADLVCERQPLEKHEIYASAVTGENIYALKEKLGAFAKQLQNPKHMVADLLSEGDVVVLVTPIDESAPKGRLILPQQMAVREVLDAHAVAITCQDTELPRTLESLAVRPKMVITDSQAFERVSADTPVDIPLTSFSILMARYKGDLPTLAAGASALSHLKDGDKALISEGCTHHRQCNDIGTVKMPAWIERFCKAKPEFTFTSGGEFPEDLSPYSLIVHCGGCMLTETAMKHRIETAISAGVPIVNYGIAIAQMHGILKRSVQMFPDILALLD